MKARADKPLLPVKNPLVLLTTAASLSEASKLSKALLRHRLAACVNLIPSVNSWYWWRGKVEHGNEVLLVIKTSRQCVKRLAPFLKSIHSYEVPELIALPVSWGDRVYLKWLGQNLKIH